MPPFSWSHDQNSLRASANDRTAFGHVINTVINIFILIKILLLITSKTMKNY